MTHFLKPTPWDKRTFKIDTYELTASHEDALQETDHVQGHFTLKVDPLENPKKIIDHGFYYMDSLTEPVCEKDHLRVFKNDNISVRQEYEKDAILQIAKDAFMHGRFHRDFNVPNSLADTRYMRWVEDLMLENKIYSLYYEKDLAGFYGFDNDKVLLLGIKKDFQGRGLAKPFTSLGCQQQFNQGFPTLYTSISAANIASLNLFYDLGFKVRKTRDVYHKLNGPAPTEDM